MFDKLGRFNWDAIFRDAHLRSWPTASLVIGKANPSGKRSPFNDDKKTIEEMAKRYGYEKISESSNTVSFLNKNKKGEKVL